MARDDPRFLLQERTVLFRLSKGSAYQALLQKMFAGGGFAPSPDEARKEKGREDPRGPVATRDCPRLFLQVRKEKGKAADALWGRLLDAAAEEPARQRALRAVADEIHSREEQRTKVVVFAPEGAAFDAAAAALRGLGRPVLIGEI